ncbi:MAG: hypothetical protein RL456_2848 [Pseudomonadota bacterium]|jgi:general secretion pathway protein L
MSLLVLQLPTRHRLHPQGPAPAATAGAPPELFHALSADGQTVQSEGRCAAALLPRATAVAAVVPPSDLAFHRITCPRAPAARMRAALAGLLEDQVLDEVDGLHLALAPGARPGEETWVAAIDREALASMLAAIEAAGVTVDRVVPAAWPDATSQGHFHVPVESDRPQVALTWSDPQGVGSWPLHGGLSRMLLPEPLPEDTLWTAEPAAAAPAERWLGQPVQVVGPAARLLAAAQGPWNLRQFDLAPRHRGLARVRDGLRQFMTPAWRPARLGLVGLALAHLVGLNAWAWMQRHGLETRRAAMLQVLRTTHPQVRAVLDPPVQMQRENDLLRAAAGRAGDQDLETLMQAAASAWPEGRPPQTLRFENGQLSLAAPGLGPDEAARMRATLAPAGWQVDATGDTLTFSRPASPGPAR